MSKRSLTLISILSILQFCLIQKEAAGLPGSNSQMQQQKEAILRQIETKSSQQAAADFNTFLLNYGNLTDTTASIYQIGEKFRDNKQFGYSITAYKYITDNQSASPQAIWAQKGMAVSNIALGKLTEGQAELNKLLENYSSDPNLGEAVFNVADAYYWFKYFTQADQYYNQVITGYPNTKGSLWAHMGLAISNIAQNKDANAESVTQKLIANYSGNSLLPEALYYIADRYEYARKNEKAKSLYQLISQQFSQSPQAVTAGLSIDRINLVANLDNNNVNVPANIDIFIDSHNGSAGLIDEVYKIAEHYQRMIVSAGPALFDYRENLIAKKLAVCERIISKFPDSSNKISTYKMAADSLRRKDTFKSIGYYQKILDTWPDYNGTGEILYSMGQCYNNLIVSGIIEKEIGIPLIKDIFERVVKNYPNTESGRGAKYCLEHDPRLQTGSTNEGGR